MKRKEVIILHLEGEVRNNPALVGMVEMLCERGWQVRLFCTLKKESDQSPVCEGCVVETFPYDGAFGLFLFSGAVEPAMAPVLERIIAKKMGAAGYLLAIDRAVMAGAYLSGKLGAPLGLLSFEITFAHETSDGFKAPEIGACKGIEFAVCQDEVRASLLCRENRIAQEKVLYVPVAGRREEVVQEKKRLFHEWFSIPEEHFVVLFAGTFADWSMAEALVEAASQTWPEHWHLVMHNRSGQARQFLESMGSRCDSQRVHGTEHAVAGKAEFAAMGLSADAGVAMYRATGGAGKNMFLGDNTRYMGRASGKISRYLQWGLPLVVNPIGVMAEETRRHRLGIVAEEPADIAEKLPELEGLVRDSSTAQRCRDYFEQNLCLDRFFPPVIDRIESRD